jgi:hypothetical protein
MLGSIRSRLVVQAAMGQEAHEWQNTFGRVLFAALWPIYQHLQTTTKFSNLHV